MKNSRLTKGHICSAHFQKGHLIVPKQRANYIHGKSILPRSQQPEKDPLFAMKTRQYSKIKRETSQSMLRRTELVLLIQLTELVKSSESHLSQSSVTRN